MHRVSEKNRLSEGPPGADGAAPALVLPGTEGPDEAAWRCAAAPGGYAWWYADVSDGRYTLTVILFAGSVFSPDYAARVREGAGDTGLDHPAVNVALFDGDRPLAWVMNEHPKGALAPLPGGLRIAGSSLRREPDGSVRVVIEEETTRFFGRPGAPLVGEVRLVAGRGPLPAQRLSAPEDVLHAWCPRLVGGSAEADLRLGGRALRLAGAAYHDGNFGAGRLEGSFLRWSWAHGTDAAAGRAVVLYEVRWRRGGGVGLLLGEDGAVLAAPLAGPAAWAAPWLRVPRRFSVGDRRCVRQPGTLLDAPFYARYRSRIEHASGPAGGYDGIGEYLDLSRFSSRGVQFLLRYKTRRVGPPGGPGP